MATIIKWNALSEGSMARTSIFLVALLCLASVAAAGSPREELNSSIEKFQKTPTDSALREKIITLARDVNPPPAIPPEARRAFVMGTTYQKEAKSADDFALAVKAFQDACNQAPWWGDAYYNLSVSLESATRYDDAKAALTLYLLTKPKDAENVQDRLAALDAKKVLAAKHAAELPAPGEKTASEMGSLSGTWLMVDGRNSDPKNWQALRAATRYPENSYCRSQFVMRGADMAFLYQDQCGGGSEYIWTPEEFGGTTYSGTRTASTWNWRVKMGVNQRDCGKNEVARPVTIEILESGNVIRTKGYYLMKENEFDRKSQSGVVSMHRRQGDAVTPGPDGCVIVEVPILFVRVGN